MRKELEEIGFDKRHRFSGIFSRYGFKYSDRNKRYAKPTMVLKDIKIIDNEGNEVPITDHLWFNLTKGFMDLGILQENEKVYFDGRVTNYQKGYYSDGVSNDYKLERPTKVVLDKPLIDESKREHFSKENWEICNRIYYLRWDYYVANQIPKPYPSKDESM